MTKTFDVKVIPTEIREKISKAAETSLVLSNRELRCPYCGFRVGTVYADTGGHIKAKCGKCKVETVFKLTPGTFLDFRIIKD